MVLHVIYDLANVVFEFPMICPSKSNALLICDDNELICDKIYLWLFVDFEMKEMFNCIWLQTCYLHDYLLYIYRVSQKNFVPSIPIEILLI